MQIFTAVNSTSNNRSNNHQTTGKSSYFFGRSILEKYLIAFLISIFGLISYTSFGQVGVVTELSPSLTNIVKNQQGTKPVIPVLVQRAQQGSANLGPCDISQPVITGNTVSGHSNTGQVFTATCSGFIYAIEVHYNGSPGAGGNINNRVLNIRDGGFPTSPIIHTQVIPYASIVLGLNVFTLTVPVAILNGEVNGWEITDAGNTANAADGVAWNVGDPYAGGDSWYSGSIIPGLDATFNVIMDGCPAIAAPTPVTATPASICPGGTSQLNATSAGNTISWFTVPSGGAAIGSSASGANFAVTPGVNTTYYAEAGTAFGNILNSPSAGSGADPRSYTLGYSFTPSSDLNVTAVRRYFGTKISIWTNTGTLLTSQAVSGTDGIWTQTALTTPVTLTAGVTYRIGVFATGTYYVRSDLGTSFANGTINTSYQIVADAFPVNVDGFRWWFVDLAYGNACSSATRTPVTVTISSNNSWTGTSSNNWFTPSNWSCGTVPIATTDVIIPSGTPNPCVISGGTAQIHNLTINAGATLTNNATLNVNGGGVVTTAGTYNGTGSFTGAVYNNSGGVVSPGLSPGCTIFGAGYTNGTGTELIEIAGITPCTQHDQLQVTGTATLSGTLDVVLFGGFVPSCGQSYKIMTSTTLVGTFATINYPALPMGLSWGIIYNGPNPGDVTLTITGNPVATATPASQTTCSGAAITPIVLTSTVASTTYAWTRDNPVVTGIANSGSGDISGTLTNPTNIPITVTFTITPTSGSCVGAPITATVTVNPTPDVNQPANQVVCNGAPTAPVTFTGTVTGTVFNWTNNTPSIGLAASGTGNIASFNAINTGTAPVVATVTVTPTTTSGSGVSNLILNGDFEAGTITGWTNAPTGGGTGWNINNGTLIPPGSSTATPVIAGNFDVVSTQTGPGLNLLSSLITLPASFSSSILDWKDRIMNYNNGLHPGCSGSPAGYFNPQQQFRVELLTSSLSLITTVFSTNPGDPYFQPGPNNRNFDVTAALLPYAGQQVYVRFRQEAQYCYFNVTLDDIKLLVNSGVVCSGTPRTFTYTVNPTPVASITPAGPVTICQGNSVTLTASATCNNYAFSGLMSGAQEVPANASTARAVFNGTFNASTNQLTINIAFSGLTANASAAHVHSAAAGVNGPVIIPLTGFPAVTSGSYSNTFTVPASEVANLLAGNTYFNIHNASFPGGEIRGQITNLSSNVFSFSGPVSGAQEVPANGSTATGNFAGTYNNNTSQLTLNLIFNNLTGGNATAAHIHSAAPGVNGPVIIPLSAFPAATSGSYSNVFTMPSAQVANFLAGNTYINIHNGGFPGGEVRGQIAPPAAVCTGATYLWSPGGQTTQSITVTTANTYSVTVTNNTNCSNSASVVVNVNPLPTVNPVPNQVVCNNNPTAAVTFTGSPAGTVYNWTNSDPSIGLAASGTGNIASFTATNTGTAPVIATVTVTPSYTNGGVTCTGTPMSFTYTVNPTPTALATPASQTICSATPITTIVITGNAVAGVVYNWTRDNSGTVTGIAASGAGNISGTLTNTTNIPITVTFTITPTANGCPGTPTTATVTVNPTPDVNQPANQVVCNGAPTAPVTFTGAVAGTVFNWTNNTPSIGLAASGTGNIASFNAINTGTAPVVATVTVTPTYTNGGGGPITGPAFYIRNNNPWGQVSNDAAMTAVFGAPNWTAVNYAVNPATVFVPGTKFVFIEGSDANALAMNTFITTNITTIQNWVTAGGRLFMNAAPNEGGNMNWGFGGVTCVYPGYSGNVTATIPGHPIYVGPFTPVTTAYTGTSFAHATLTGGGITNLMNGNAPGQVLGTLNWGSGSVMFGTMTTVNWHSPAPQAQNLRQNIIGFAATPLTLTCSGTPRTFTYTVNPTATVTVPPNAFVCNGSVQSTGTYNFSTTATGGVTTYSWTNNNITIGLGGSGTGNSLPTFTATNSGTAPITGTITVTPTFTNGGVSCVGTPNSFSITVNPTPNATATPASQTICSAATITTIVITGTVPGTVFNWTRDNTATATGIAASGTGNISGSLTNTTTGPVLVTFTITPTYTNGGTTCSGTPVTATVLVNPLATVNTVPNQIVCNGDMTSPVNFTSPTTGGTIVYNWTNNLPSIGLAASGTGNIAAFAAINATNAPVTATITVTPTYTNGGISCVGTPSSFTITVNPTPQVDQPANQVVCNGAPTAPVNFTGPVAGTVFNWSNNNTSIGLAASGTGNIPSFIATNVTNAPVVATVTVTPTTGGGGLQTFNFDGSLQGWTSALGGTNCQNNNWVVNTWGLQANAFAGANSIGVTTVGGEHSYILSPILSFAAGTTTITFKSFSNNEPGYSCSYDVEFIEISTDGGSTWTTLNGGSVNNLNNVSNDAQWRTITITGTTIATSNGRVRFRYDTGDGCCGGSGTNNGWYIDDVVISGGGGGGVTCTGPSKTFTYTVNPTPTVNPVANQVVCHGSPTAAVNFTGFVPGTVYSWTNNTPSIGLAASGTGNIASFVAMNLTNAPVIATITVTPTYTNGGVSCVGSPISFTIRVNPLPIINPVPNQVVCNNTATAPVNFTTPTTGGTAVYNWTNNNTTIGLAASGTGNIPSFIATNATNGPNLATITVTLIYTSGGISCASTPINFTITVNPTPTVNPVANQVVCNGSPTAPVNFTSPTTGGTAVYNWTNNNTSIGLAASGTGNIPSFIGTNATNAPNVATITVTMIYTNGGISCVSAPINFTITVNPTPIVNPVANQVVCNGSPTTAVNFTSPTTGGTIIYNWVNTLPSIGLAASGTGNIASFIATNTTNAPVVATITVIAIYNNGGINCTSQPVSFTITVNPTPTVNQPPNQVLCHGSPTAPVIFTGSVPGTLFSWTNNNTSIGLGGGADGNIPSFIATNVTNVPQVATITVTPTYTNGGVSCTGTPRTFTITVNPIPSVTPVADQRVCAGATLAINFTGPVAGTVYSWTNTNTAIGLGASGIGNLNFVATNTSAIPISGTVTVTPTYTNGGVSCTGTPISFVINVNPTPTVNPVANQVVCNGSATAAITFSGTVTGTVFNWTNNTTSIGLAASGTGNIASFTATNITNAPVVATITVTPVFTAGGVTCTGPTQNFTITVNPTPSVNAIPNQVVCNGTTISTIVISGPVAGTVYSWTNNNTAIGLAGSGTGNIPAFVAVNTTNAPITATIAVTPTYTNGGVSCSGTPISFTITVNPMPTVNAIANQMLCNGSATAAINFTGSVAGTTYSWTNSNTSIGLAASGTGNIASFIATNTTNTVQTATITVTPSAAGCAGTSISFTITVNPTPTVNQPANQTVCHGSSTAPVVFTGSVAGTLYTWSNDRPSIGLNSNGTGNIPSFVANNATPFPVVATITVTPTYNNGGVICTGAAVSFTITVNPQPNIVFNMPPRACLTDTLITLRAFPAGGTWSGSGVSGGIFSASAAGLGVHTLSYTFTNSNGCTAVSYFSMTVNDCKERHNVFATAIRLYPNPSSGLFNIRFLSDIYTEFNVKVVTASGQELRSYHFNNLRYGSVIPMDLRVLPGGTYFLQIYNASERAHFPFVIVR